MNNLTLQQTKDVREFLNNVRITFSSYLDHTTIESLCNECENGNEIYFKGLLSTLRRLVVMCEDASDACDVILLSSEFRKLGAEKTLYQVYHHVIQEFFSPKRDFWFEDSRSAYTGRNSIRFSEEVPPSFKSLINGVEADFQRIREELEYYETDYRTKIQQSKAEN